jgi:plasmid stabilization system protein ParE
LKLNILRRAAKEMRERIERWRATHEAAPTMLEDELEHAFDLMLRHPRIGLAVANTRTKNVRLLHLTGSRHDVYYRPTKSSIHVLRVWHTSRGEKPKL